MSGAEQFINAAFGSHGQQEREFSGAVVTGINKDNTVNVNYLGQEHVGLDAMSSYTNRLPGDVVMIRSNGASWVIIGRAGGEADSSPSISWGYGSPEGDGWVDVTATYVHPDGRVYFRRSGTFSGDYTNTISTPQPMILPSSDYNYIDDNLLDTSTPLQGTYDGTDAAYAAGPWSGAWIYGTQVTDAVAAKEVRSMEVRLERYQGDHGLDGPVSLRIYTHDHTDKVSTLVTNFGPFAGPSLELGQSTWWPVPRRIIDLFVSDSVKGFAIKSSRPEDFFVAAKACGEVRIYN